MAVSAAAIPPPDEPAETRGSRRRAVGLSSAVGLLLGGAATFFVVHTLVGSWSEVRAALQGASWRWLVLGFALAAGGMASVAWGWRSVFRLLGVDVPAGRTIAWYFVGELGKYLPGGVWPVLGRGELARRGGVPRGRAYASVGLSLLVLYLAATFVAVGLLPFALSGGGFSPWMLFLLALPAGLVVLHHGVLERLLGLARRLTGRELPLEVPSWRQSVAVVVRYIPSWLMIGGATWAVARSLTPDASFARVMFAATLSWLAGFLAVPVPAGAGIREAVLVAASGLPGGIAAATAVGVRLMFVAVDGIGAAISAPIAGRRRAGAAVGPVPGREA
ncbi:MAG: hypothetical protein JWM05_322 [Acidimicrobiales bacterium]|nr:hypothetical protein [Acidimicrobiales bacterium]